MEFIKTSDLYTLNKSTYVNLRWIGYIGQLLTILFVQFIFKYDFNYLICILIVFLGILTNINLQFRIKNNQLQNNFSTIYLVFDILQISTLFFFLLVG